MDKISSTHNLCNIYTPDEISKLNQIFVFFNIEINNYT